MALECKLHVKTFKQRNQFDLCLYSWKRVKERGERERERSFSDHCCCMACSAGLRRGIRSQRVQCAWTRFLCTWRAVMDRAPEPAHALLMLELFVADRKKRAIVTKVTEKM